MKQNLFTHINSAGKNEGIKRFMEEFGRWNKTYALTSIAPEKTYDYLIAPSAWLVGSGYLDGSGIIADFGTGYGIPGLVMAILDGERQYKLIESSRKKASFLHRIVKELQLDNCEVVCRRVDKRNKIEGVDLLVSRAAGTISEIVDITSANTPRFIFFKGNDAEPELDEFNIGHTGYRAEIIDIPLDCGGLRSVLLDKTAA